MSSLLTVAAFAVAASTSADTSERARAQSIVDAWAQTGACGSDPFRGRCGVIAAVRDGAGDVTYVQAAAGAVADPAPAAIFSPSTLFEIASNTKVGADSELWLARGAGWCDCFARPRRGPFQQGELAASCSVSAGKRLPPVCG